MLIFAFVFTYCVVLAESNTDCILSTSCASCSLFSSCYWCGSATDGICREFESAAVAQYECGSQWSHGDCPLDRNQQAKKNLDQMLNMLSDLKPHHDDEKQDVPNVKSDDLQNLFQQTNKEEKTNTDDLKDLLHKLLLLKLLKKVKTAGSTLTDEDRALLSQLLNKKTTTTKAPTTVSENVNNELSELLALLKNKEINSVLTTLKPKISKTPTRRIMVRIKSTLSSIDNSATLPNHAEEGKVNYEETDLESLPKATMISPTVTNPMNNKTKEETKEEDANYCNLYEETGYCNSDHNCTWCNTFDMCIRRNDKDYKTCVESKENVLDKTFGLDRCLAKKRCKQCVADDKCYWCDVSKSCHTYPFFGYVAHSCGGDWYYKQCDVQLAVVVIVLPLIIILLAMVIFYFCLKYCYYRRKVLRVPLFERPGVFDYRKDKKVYFVNPEDEGSDDELETENIRKKYRLPVERAPLIDPDS